VIRLLQLDPRLLDVVHQDARLRHSVARWYIFKAKNPNLGKLWRVLQ
jgi:hypothetical protein